MITAAFVIHAEILLSPGGHRMYGEVKVVFYDEHAQVINDKTSVTPFETQTDVVELRLQEHLNNALRKACNTITQERKATKR